MKCMNKKCDYFNLDRENNCGEVGIVDVVKCSSFSEMEDCHLVTCKYYNEVFRANCEQVNPDVDCPENKYTQIDTPKDPKSMYYDHGGIITLDIIRAKLTPEQYEGFLLGQILKYSCRANFKDQKARDIEKISFYATALRSETT